MSVVSKSASNNEPKFTEIMSGGITFNCITLLKAAPQRQSITNDKLHQIRFHFHSMGNGSINRLVLRFELGVFRTKTTILCVYEKNQTVHQPHF